MVAIFLPECGGGGCSWVEHRWMGTSLGIGLASTPSGWNVGVVVGSRWRHAIGLWGCTRPPFFGGVWLVLPSMADCCVGGGGVGLFFENCIVDASIL